MNNPIQQWAAAQGVSEAAYLELMNILKAPSELVTLAKQVPQSEGAVQQKTMLDWSKLGGVPWRNNVGVASDPSGRPVRYGLANISKRMNEQVKSSDVIGITPIVVTLAMVGRTVGVFTAVECKHGGWKWGGYPDREVPQLAYHNIVRGLGGIAGFVSEPCQYAELVAEWYPREIRS